MNYIELINRFWAFNEEVSFQSTDVALYFYLLKVNNACSWKVMFRRNNYKIMADLSIRSPKTLAESRNRLKQAGMIDFQTKNGSAEVTYSITSVKNTEVDDEVNAEVGDEVRARLGSRLIPSKDKLKQKLKHIPPLSPVPGEADISKVDVLDLDHKPMPTDPSPAPPGGKRKSCAKKKRTDSSFIEDEKWRELFDEWLEYKAANGKSYKSEQSVRLCYRKLERLSGGDHTIAREMIEEAMANNWQSFFEIKRPTNNDPRTTNRHSIPDNPVYRSDNDDF